MYNIFDVAKLAGVSKSTVSRVINNRGNIKAATREKVEAAMRELNYTPSYFAQSIRTGKAKMVALLVPDASNLYYNELFKAIADSTLQRDYLLIMCDISQERAHNLSYMQLLRQRSIDGIIYCMYRSSSPVEPLIELSHEIPMVFMDYPNAQRTDISCVSADGLQDIAWIMNMFRKQGRKCVAYVGLDDIITNNYRYLGYCASVTACGYDFDPRIIVTTSLDSFTGEYFKIGYRAAEYLMTQNPRPDAIICATDMLAIGVNRYLLEKGYRIPDDVAVTGYDNIEISSVVFPAISTMAQPICKMGAIATDIIFKKMEDNTYNKSVLLPSAFVERAST